jgi:sensor histidine kinase YesM
MKIANDLSIGKRLGMIMCFAFVTIITIELAGIINSRRLVYNISLGYEAITRPLAAIASARGQFNAMRTALHNLAHDFNTAEQNAWFRTEIMQNLSGYERNISLYKEILEVYGTNDPNEQEAVDYLYSQLAPLRKHVEHIISIAERTGHEADAVRILRSGFLNAAEDISLDLMLLTEILESQANDANLKAGALFRETVIVFAVVMVVYAIVLSFSVYLFALSILRPIKTLVNGLGKIAGGDLDARIEDSYNNEFDKIKDAVNSMAANIKTLFAEQKLKQEKISELENELVQKQISVMLSQIQPHFLYNTLSAIRELCLIDPKTASQTIEDFSLYLRGNLDALTIANIIPFEKELKHVETYLALEKKRFGYKLNITQDITVHDFSLPALTLQLVVENAVRHGVTKRSKGGTVAVKTEENETCYIIAVIDDGVGFNPSEKKQDARSHVGIENVRSRLASMCGGTLDIRSRPGAGTTAVITIPKGA